MRVLLVYTDADFYAGTGYDAAWRTALEAEGATVEQLARVPERWYRDGPPRDVDLVVAHVLAEEVIACGETLRAAALLEQAGIPLLNPTATLVASADKLATHAIWAAAGLRQPRTWSLGHLGTWPVGAGEELVVKPTWGDGARDIVMAASLEDARAAAAPQEALVQERVVEPEVARVFATPWSTSKAYWKAREPGALVTHGTTYPRSGWPEEAVADLAKRMVATLGGGLMGVDVLQDEAGELWALEANAPFGFDVTDPEQGQWVARAALEAARAREVRAQPGRLR